MSESSRARRIQREVGCKYQVALNALREWVQDYRMGEPFGDYMRRGEQEIIKRLKEGGK